MWPVNIMKAYNEVQFTHIWKAGGGGGGDVLFIAIASSFNAGKMKQINSVEPRCLASMKCTELDRQTLEFKNRPNNCSLQ